MLVEVLGMLERGEPVSTGDKAIPTVCHPQWDHLAEVLAVLMGAIPQRADEYRFSSFPHSSPPETSTLYLPKTITPPSRTHLLVQAWLYAVFLLS